MRVDDVRLQQTHNEGARTRERVVDRIKLDAGACGARMTQMGRN